MDYFNELLDSYNKLKKRSFKLRYISEAEEKKASKKKAASTPAKTSEQKKKEEDNQSLEKAKALAEKYVGSAPQVPPQEPDTVAWVQREASTVVKDLAGVETSMRIYKSKGGKSAGLGDVMVMGLSPRGIVSLSKGGSLTKHFEDFVKRLAGEEKGGEGADGEALGEEEEARLAEEARQAQLMEKIGGAEQLKLLKERAAAQKKDPSQLTPEEIEEDKKKAKEIIAGSVEQYQQQLKIVDEFCRNAAGNGGELPEDLKFPCSRALSYIAGGANTSLEWKLAHGVTVCIDPRTDKKTDDYCPPAPGLKAEVARSATHLMEFLQPESDKADCARIGDSVGLHGGKMVLFGGSTEEGMVMTANSLQRLAISNITKKCAGAQQLSHKRDKPMYGKFGLTDILERKINTANRNAIKGTLYELIPSLVLRMDEITAAMEAGDGARAKKLGKAAAKWLQDSIKVKHLPLLEKLAEEMPSRDIDGYVAQVIAQEQLDIIHGSATLRDFLLREAAGVRGFIRGTGATAVIHTGLAPKSGNRADNALLFRTREKADAYSDQYAKTAVRGSTVGDIIDKAPKKEQDQLRERLTNKETGLGLNEDETVFLAGFGQKRKGEFEDTKGGETNTIERQGELTGVVPVTGPIKGVEDGFIELIATDLYGKDTARQHAQEVYGKGLEKTIRNNTANLAEPQTYVNKDGTEIKVSSAQVACDFVRETITQSLAFKALINNPVGRLFYDGKAKRDLGNSETQQRIQEGVQRFARFGAMKRDYESVTGNEKEGYKYTDEEGVSKKATPAQIKKQLAVTDHLIRNLMADAYNVDNMAQQMQNDKGEVVAFSQKGPMKKIIEARNNGTLKIRIKGATSTFVIDGVDIMKWSQEGNWEEHGGDKKAKRITRSVSTFEPACWEGKNNLYDGPPPSIKKEDILYQFLKGQQNLLEKLLTPSTEHHSYQV